MNLITNNFTEDDIVYTIDLDDVVYYRCDNQYATGTYFTNGTLYGHTVGGSPVSITTKVVGFASSNAEFPIIEKFVSKENDKSYSYIADFGTFSDGKYSTLLKNITR